MSNIITRLNSSKLDHNGEIMANIGSQNTLTLVATPIGNMGDISIRAIAAFQAADLILCEDTRVSKKLLSRYNIETKLLSYHEHNAEQMRPKIINELRSGAKVILISDAGTPTISDPGYQLVQACIKANIIVSTIPGPTALIAALTISGLPTDSFYFGGFLPNKQIARRKVFMAKKELDATLIFYDSAKRLLRSLADAIYCFTDRHAAVARELTKLHEDVRRGSLTELYNLFEKSGAPRGEVVILIGPPDKKPVVDTKSLRKKLRILLLKNTLRDSVKIVSDDLGIKRSIVYEQALKISKEEC
jgi:16S rRNA (cytidine1402-2'-O)-methyltransferase